MCKLAKRFELVRQLAELGNSINVDLGTVIFREGERGDAFYIVRSGRLRVTRNGIELRPRTVGYLYPGDHFGEGALLTKLARRATVRATEPGVLLRVSKSSFLKAVASNRELKNSLEEQVAEIAYRDFTRFLNAMDGPEDRDALQDLFQRLKRDRVSGGTRIIRQGDAGDRFFLVATGRLRMEAVGVDRKNTTSCKLEPGAFFGAVALVKDVQQPADVSAETDVVLYSLSKADFLRGFNRLPGIRRASLDSIEHRLIEPMSEGGVDLPVNAAVSDPTTENAEGEVEDRSNPHAEHTAQRGSKSAVFRRFPFIRQHDETDCAAACLGMVCKHFGMPIGLNKLREMTNVSAQGASLAGLAEAAETLGFVTQGVRTGFENLKLVNLPVIVHWEGNHFVVLFRVSDDYVMVADPALGVKKLSIEAFERGWTGVALRMTYTDRVADNEPTRTSFRRFWPLVRPYTGVLVEVLLASLVMSLFGLASPIFTQTIVDRVLVHQDRELLNLMLVGMVVVALFQMATSALRTYLIAFVSSRLSITMLSRFYRHLLNLPMRFFALRRVGDLTTRFGENSTIQGLLTGTTISVVLDVVMLFVYLGLMLYYNARLTLVVLAFMPLSVILTLIYTPILKSLSQRAFLAEVEQSSVLIDSLHGIDAVKTASVERDTRWKWEERFTKQIQVGLHGTKIGMVFGSVGGLMNLFSSTFILWYGATLVIDGELSVGQLMAFNAMIGNVTGPILGLIGLWPEVQEARIALDRLNDIYETPMEASRHGDNAVTLKQVSGKIVLEKVFFRYGGGPEEPYVLNDINLEVEPGQKVAIVGRSGAGKTTLVKLIPRLFDPTDGRVMLDGIDLRDFDPGSLRRQVGMVLQDPFMFGGTIADNIALGVEDLDMDRMLEVSRLAHLHEVVEEMPIGYETKVGEQGIGLSGGQRQRVAIARALYHDPRILIFDEATNALDTESEHAIREGLAEMLGDRTAFVIAHRLSTIRDADAIVVLDRGHIVETGSHIDLVEKQGLYFHLTRQQIDAV